MYKKARKYQEINLSEFTLFLSVMQNRTAYESVLSIILDEPDLALEDVKVEHVVLNDRGKKPFAWMHGPGTKKIARLVQKCRTIRLRTICRDVPVSIRG